MNTCFFVTRSSQKRALEVLASYMRFRYARSIGRINPQAHMRRGVLNDAHLAGLFWVSRQRSRTAPARSFSKLQLWHDWSPRLSLTICAHRKLRIRMTPCSTRRLNIFMSQSEVFQPLFLCWGMIKSLRSRTCGIKLTSCRDESSMSFRRSLRADTLSRISAKRRLDEVTSLR